MSALSFVTIGLNVLTIALSIAALFTPIYTMTGDIGGAETDAKVTLWETAVSVSIQGLSADGRVSWDELCGLTSQLEPDILTACDIIKGCRATLILAAAFALFSIGGIAASIFAGNDLLLCASSGLSFLSLLCNGVSIGLICVLGTSDLNGVGFILLCISTAMSLFAFSAASLGFVFELQSLSKLVKESGISTTDRTGSKQPVGTRAQRALKQRQAEHEGMLSFQANYARNQQQKDLKEGTQTVGGESSGGSRPQTQEGQEDGKEEEPEKPKRQPMMLQKVLFHKGGSEEDEIPLEMLEAAFNEIDEDDSGSIDLVELVEALRLCGLEASKAATETIIKEIDKNASGDVDLYEFIEFFRHIEELDRFDKKSAARQQFLTFLLNFCFLADIIVVGVMLMLFIKMDKDESPDDYSIMRNILIVCTVLLGILFLCVICIPILQLSLGPTIHKMSDKYELSKQLKNQRRGGNDPNGGGGPSSPSQGPRAAAWSGGQMPQVDAQEYGNKLLHKSYRANLRNDTPMYPPAMDEREVALQALNNRASAASVVRASQMSDNRGSTQRNTQRGGGGKRGSFRYDPDKYKIAEGVAITQELPSSFSPMQVRDMNNPMHTQGTLPGAPAALTDSSFPMYNN